MAEKDNLENSTAPASLVGRLVMLKHEYLVSYFGKNSGGACNGRCFLTRDNPITCADDIVQVEAVIKNDSCLYACGVASFQLLRTYEA